MSITQPDLACGQIPEPDRAAYRRMQRLLRNAISPAAPLSAEQLGRLKDVAAFFAGARSAVPPEPIGRAQLVVFGAHHGIAERVETSSRADATDRIAAGLATGQSPAAVTAPRADCGVTLIDVALRGEVPGFDQRTRVREGVGRIDVEDAMDTAELERSFALGQEAASHAIDSGADVVAPAVFGAGVELAALAVMGRVTGIEPVALLGFEGTDDRRWVRRLSVVRDAMFRARATGRDPAGALRVCGGCDLVAVVGFVAEAAARRTPIVLDGMETAVAALCADTLAPGSGEWVLPGALTPGPAHARVLRALGRRALFAINVPVGQGFQALTTLSILRSAVVIARGCELPEPAGPQEPPEPAEAAHGDGA
ncbi:nicotinate-nucleotide--dimethylbenzimidazole phosphoribosyltransferase [Corynebacterium atypicum]|uniref:nicotinate-nucleotide--dimethylbenzimidazole phosphoribosyltransferase n=1 Tax=Corynebacterium atypicum TaxID=191610 RepID=UPI00068D34C7|nr:nicotinate-nucleotide--dimethylbenzimidazole phosphoribosyltransferase [Corynebacterium atypicum]